MTGVVIGSIATGAFNYITTRQRLKAENTRRHADYFLQQKVNALSELHSQLEQCRQAYQYNWEQALEMTEKDVESTIMSRFYGYEEAMSRASIFLDNDQMVEMREVFEQFRSANAYFFWFAQYGDPDDGLEGQVPDFARSFPEVELREAVDEAREVLREEISEPASYFES